MKFSVVTPSFNQGRFIERTLRSVAAQRAAGSSLEIEHVVFDGGSTDETTTVLRAFGGAVRWQSERDRGQADAVNRGIRATDGDVIAWINSDDVYYPGAFERVAAVFRDHPEVDAVYGMADHIGMDDQAFETYPTEPWDYARLKVTCFICQPALFFRRSVVDRFGLLDENLHYCMDYEYWLRLAKCGARFHFLPEKLAGSRLYADNKTLGARVKVHREINDMMKRTLGAVPERWLYNYAHALAESTLVRSQDPGRFGRILALRSLSAAFHWNRLPSLAMWRQSLRWILQPLKA